MQSATVRAWVVGAVVAVGAVACAGPAENPTSPSSSLPGGLAAAPDGSTFKTEAPGLSAPAAGSVVPRQVTLVIQTPAVKYATGIAHNIQFELYDSSGNLLASWLVAAGTTTTSAPLSTELEYSQIYTWRARAALLGQYGPWSGLFSFTVEDPPPPPPPSSSSSATGDCTGNVSRTQMQAIVLSTTPLPEPGEPIPFRNKVLENANDKKWGFHRRPNGKISEDVVALDLPGGNPHYIFDIVVGSKGSNPTPSWSDITDSIEPGSVFVPFCTP